LLAACQACCLPLVAWYPEAWSLQLLTIDQDPGAKLGPVIAHDLELSRDGQQLGVGRVFNFYCKLFHLFLSFLPLEVFLIHLKLLDRLTYPN